MKSETFKVLERALQVLRFVSDASEGCTLTDVADGLNLPVSTARRFLQALRDEGFVDQGPEDQKFQSGLALLGLLSQTHRTNTLLLAAQPVMERLRDTTGETVGLHIRFKDGRLCVALAESRHPLRYVVELGELLPLHAGASSRIFLAFLPPEERDEYIRRGPLQVYTDQTIVDPDALRNELERVEQDGYAFGAAEVNADGAAIGAPIRDSLGRVVASLGLNGPVSRLTDKRMKQLIPAVVEVANQISQRLGYSVVEASSEKAS